MKNKKMFWIAASGLWLLAACGNGVPENFQVKGKLSNSKGEYVSLVNVNSRQPVTIDSAKIDENGEFIFMKKVPEKGFYSIQISQSNFTTIITDSSEHVVIEGSALDLKDSTKATGSPDTEEFYKFNETTKPGFKAMENLRMKQDSIRRVFEAYMNTTHDTVELAKLSRSLEPIFDSYSEEYRKKAEEINEYVRKFIDEHYSSFVSLAAIQMLSPEKDIAYFIKVADALSAKYPNIETMKEFKKYVDKEKSTAMGMPAPDITLNDASGKPRSLSSLKGKVVIVDFWASWCKPCRAENPFVVSLYKRYHDKGLEMFSVSLDEKKEAWQEAIKKDQLSWENHVCDFKMWQSPVVELYGFSGIPFACVLDREGKIAGKNLRGPQLEAKITELLGNP